MKNGTDHSAAAGEEEVYPVFVAETHGIGRNRSTIPATIFRSSA